MQIDDTSAEFGSQSLVIRVVRILCFADMCVCIKLFAYLFVNQFIHSMLVYIVSLYNIEILNDVIS